MPQFLAYEDIKAPITEGGGREPMILIFGWPRTLHFPDVPVFHAQNVGIRGSQYGAIGIRLGTIFAGVTPTNKITTRTCTNIREFLGKRTPFD